MTENSDPKRSESHPESARAQRGRQEAGQREQGVRTERTEDLSSPQVTTPAEGREGAPTRAGKNG
jgi:hypothetical protein